MTSRWRIIVEYKGTDYHGWQIQNDVPTIQGEIQKAIFKFCHQDIQVVASGRTDAGVHARAQVVHFDIDDTGKAWDAYTIMSAINAHLRPQPICVLHAELCDPEFHARFGAKSKIYHYIIAARMPYLTIDEGRMWHVKRNLDVVVMHDAAQLLVGKHDFSSFRDSECQSASPVKTLDHVAVSAEPYDDFGGQRITIEVRAQSFLHHQVRNFAGSLKLVGEGKWSKHDLQNVLNAKDRKAAGPTAPACGLYMHRVYYES